MHDLSDGYAIPSVRSCTRAIGAISTNSAQLRSDDGATYFDLNPTTQKIKIVAPGGLEVDTPLATFSQAVTINGLLSFLGGLVGSATSGAAAVITGAIKFIGTLTSNGKDISNSHTHGGVQTGSGNTNGVN